MGWLRDLVFGVPPPGPEEARLLRQIAFDPDNLTLYREYGEWLKKNGDPEWGEFVLLDIYLEPLPANDPRRNGHDERWSQLYGRLPKRRFAPLARIGLQPLVCRKFIPLMWLKHGVINAVEIKCDGILPQRAERLFRAAPGLQILEFATDFVPYRPDLERIMVLPQMEQISQLRFGSHMLHHDQITTLAASAGMRNIQRLDVSNIKMPPEEKPPPGSLPGIPGSPREPKLPTSAPDWPLLFGSNNLRKLREFKGRFTTFSDDALVALVRNPHITHMRVLEMGGGRVTCTSVVELAKSPKFKPLEIFELPDAQLYDTGAIALAESPHLRSLKELMLNKCQIDEVGAAALFNSPNLANVTRLELKENIVGNDGAVALANSPHVKKVEKLYLSCNSIKPPGMIALAASPNLQNVTELDLSYNGFEDAGAIALANSPHLTKLEDLDISDCMITDVGLAAILRAPWLQQLKKLKMSNNPIGEAGAQLLLKTNNLKNLEWLSLWRRDDDYSGATAQALKDRYGSVVSM